MLTNSPESSYRNAGSQFLGTSPARPAGPDVLKLARDHKHPLPCPARLAGSQVSSRCEETSRSGWTGQPGRRRECFHFLTTKRPLMPDKLAWGEGKIAESGSSQMSTGYLRCVPRRLAERRKPDVSARNVGLCFCIHDLRFQI
jgi:hypothetical protein